MQLLSRNPIRSFVVVFASVSLAACGGDLLTDLNRDTGGPQFEIVDGTRGGGQPHFLWWTPIVIDAPVPDGRFDPTQSPTVEICALADPTTCGLVLVTYNTVTRVAGGIIRVDLERELYKVVFKSVNFALDVNTDYRITVRNEGTELGHADIDLISDPSEVPGVDRSAFTPLIIGSSLSIRFRIEEPDAPGPPVAVDDAYSVEVNTTLVVPDGDPGLLANDALGDPTGTLVSFGGGNLGGDETAHVAGSTVAPLPEGSGSLTVGAGGSVTFTPPTDFLGNYTFQYRLENTEGASTATVTITVSETPPPPPFGGLLKWWRPVVRQDEPAEAPFDPTLAPEVEICALAGTDCGTTVVTYDMSAVVAGGIVRLDPDRELYKVQFKTANFTLDVQTFYRITVRVSGQVLRTRDIDLVADQAEADLVDYDLFTPLINGNSLNIRFRIEAGEIEGPPTAEDDAYTLEKNRTLVVPDGQPGLLANDALGAPAGSLVSFGGGSLGGDETSHLAGSTVSPLPQGSGSLTVGADGSMTFLPPTDFLGDYTFLYKLENPHGSVIGMVTISVSETPPPPPSGALFKWREPVIPDDEPLGGPFNPNLLPTVEICALAGSDCASTVVTYNSTTRVAGGIVKVDLLREVYKVLFKTYNFALDVNTFYRILVRVDGVVLGTRDIDMVIDQEEANLVDQSLYVPIVIGNTFNIRFAIEESPASAEDDQYTASGNITIELDAANGVLSNDIGSSAVVEVNGAPGNVGAPTATAAVGRGGVTGQVTVNADGSFSYDPPPGFEGADTFTYGTNAGLTATVTIAMSGMVWFVDNSAAGSLNHGTFTDPFTSLGDFNAANGGIGTQPDPKPGDFIALRTGVGTYVEADGVNLLDDQLLIGEAVAFSSAFTADANSSAAYQAFAGASNGGPLVEVTGAGNNGIDLAANNTVRGLTVGDIDVTPNVASYGMAGDAVGNLVVDAVSITGLGGALDVRGGSFGTNVVFDELSATTPAKEGIRVRNSSGTITITDPTSAIVGSQGGQAVRIGGGSLTMDYPGPITQHLDRHIVEISNTSGGVISFSGTVSQAHAGGKGVKFSGVDGDVTFVDLDLGTDLTRNGGEGAGVLIEPIFNANGTVNDSEGTFSFTDVSIFVTGAGNAGVRVTNTVPSGALVISGGTIDGDGVPAIDVELIALTLTSVDVVSLNSEREGIRLHDVTGAVSLTGITDVDGSTNAGIAVQNSAGALALDLQTVDVATAGSDGVRVTSAGTGSVCLNLAGSASVGVGNGYTLDNGATSTFHLQDFAGDGSLAVDVAAWVTTTKTNAGTVGVTVGSPFTASAGACVP